jgi:hypothetical protein
MATSQSPPPDGLIAFEVLANNVPHVIAQIDMTGGPEDYSFSTDFFGCASKFVLTGTYVVTVSAKDYVSWVRKVTIYDQGTYSYRVNLKRMNVPPP